MAVIDLAADAQRVFAALHGGGVAIFPNDLGYAMPTDDPLFGHGTIREDGRHMHTMYVVQVKRPEESSRPWDYVRVLDVIPAGEAAKPLAPGECVLGKA